MSATLIALDGGARIAVPEGGLVLGREPDPKRGAIHRIDNKAASREHCRIRRTGDAWTLEDLDSANGTFVNDVEAVGPTRLAPGDVVRLGQGSVVVLTARFEIAEELGAAPVPIETVAAARLVDAESALAAARVAAASASAEAADLRAQLRAAETVRLAAEERERQARLREQAARVGSDESVSELVQARNQLSEALALNADLRTELAAAREKLLRFDAGETETVRTLRLQLDDRSQRCLKLERELGQRTQQIGELEVAIGTAFANRDAALETQSTDRTRVEELERIVQEQSNLLQRF